MIELKEKVIKNEWFYNSESRHCTVHNFTEDGQQHGQYGLYYSPEERGLNGVNTFEKCKNWCFEDLYCGLALWYEEKEECYAYRFRGVKKNEQEELIFCRTDFYTSRRLQCFPFFDFEALYNSYDMHYDFYPSKFISCTSYKSKY